MQILQTRQFEKLVKKLPRGQKESLDEVIKEGNYSGTPTGLILSPSFLQESAAPKDLTSSVQCQTKPHDPE